MCFFVHPKHPNEKIAKKDLTCYKYGKLKTLHRNGKQLIYFNPACWTFQYKLGKEVHLSGKLAKFQSIVWDNTIQIEEGFHSHTCMTKKINAIIRNKGDYSVSQFVIPKGSAYYYNPEAHEYVSDRIKFVKVIYKGKK